MGTKPVPIGNGLKPLDGPSPLTGSKPYTIRETAKESLILEFVLASPLPVLL
jgi:hypothetical protein